MQSPFFHLKQTIMIGLIIWIIGLVLTVKAAIEILQLDAALEKKLLAAILVVITSWLGLAVYYFYAKERMSEWLK